MVDELEPGRLDLAVCDEPQSPVDVAIVAHVFADDELEAGRKLMDSVRQTFDADVSLHARAKVYSADYNSVVVLPSAIGLAKSKFKSQEFAERSLHAYKQAMEACKSQTVDIKQVLTHEVMFPDGASVFWAGA